MSIQEHLNKIRNAVYGREVRESIAKGIETAYDDASEKDNANMEVKLARGTNPNLNTRLNKMDETDRQNTERIGSNYNEVTAQLDQTKSSKVDKSGSGQVKWSNIAQDAREQISGDKVAVVEDDSIITTNLTDNVIKTSKIGKKEVTAETTNFITRSSNLLNRDDVVEGKVISVTGEINDSDDYYYSHRIDVLPNQTLFTNYISSIAWYDQNDNFISRSNITSEFTTVPDNAYYARANITRLNFDSLVRSLQISVGAEEVPYEPFYERIDNIQVPADKLVGQLDTSVIKDESVTPEKTTFINTSTNKLNTDTLTYNKTIDSATGELVDSVSRSTTDFIKVEPSANYTFFGADSLGYYDENYDFISYGTLYAIDAPMSKRMETTTHYIRVVIYNQSIPTAQINKGDVLLPYERYGNRLSGSVVASQVENNSIGENDIINDSVTIKKANFIVKPKNLLNADTLSQGFAIDASTGELTSSNSTSVSDFIEVTPNTEYIGNHSRFGLYDADKNFILSAIAVNFRTTGNTAYVRVGIHQSTTQPQLNEGTTLLPYEKWHKPRLNEDIDVPGAYSDENTNENTDENAKFLDKYVINGKLDEYYAQEEALPERGEGRGHDVVYDFYDNLVDDYPEYVTRINWNTSVRGVPIYGYDFNLPETRSPELKTPTMILVSGTHGQERMSVIALAHAMNHIARKWKDNESLETLRWNCNFRVIPLVNPDSWNMWQRKNANEIDINRQFPAGFVVGDDPQASTYGGTEPLTEPEAIAVKELLDDTEDVIYFGDFHNFSTKFDESNKHELLWNVHGTLFNANLAKSLYMDISRNWKKRYSYLPQDDTTIFGYTSKSNNGTMGTYAASLGIQSSTFEFSSGLHAYNPDDGAYGSDAVTLFTEAAINWLIINLRNNIRL